MELGTGTSSSSSSNSTDHHSLNGLTFGQKIYFEDVGIGGGGGGAQGKSPSVGGGGGSSSGLPPPAPSKKGRSSGGVQGGQPPKCQVEGCQVDLSGAKAYYSRHKVCGMHSKSPRVTVAGNEQRFCQQCSRFHQLSEFDQTKRSCRRRLAGHNERRRKPPPGSISSTRYGTLSPSIYESNSRSGGFVMDFSSYPNHITTGSDSARTEKFVHQQQWQSISETIPSGMLLPNSSVTRTGFPGPGDCFNGVSDSTRVRSLLSNQPWCSNNHRPSSFGVNDDMVDSNGSPVVQPSGTHGVIGSHFSNPSWGFKGNEGTTSSSHEMPPGLGLGPMSHYPSELEVTQQSGRQYLELDHSRGYDSSSVQHMHWSL